MAQVGQTHAIVYSTLGQKMGSFFPSKGSYTGYLFSSSLPRFIPYLAGKVPAIIGSVTIAEIALNFPGLGKKIYDTTSGFRACSSELIYDFSLSYPSEYPEPITTVEVLKKKYVVSEVSVEMNEREGGVSSIRAWKSVYYMLNVCLALLAVKIRRYKRCR